jgi:hypothetical protein
MYCPSCGKRNAEYSAYCIYCGKETGFGEVAAEVSNNQVASHRSMPVRRVPAGARSNWADHQIEDDLTEPSDEEDLEDETQYDAAFDEADEDLLDLDEMNDEELSEISRLTRPASRPASTSIPPQDKGLVPIRILRVFAWADLVLSTLAALALIGLNIQAQSAFSGLMRSEGLGSLSLASWMFAGAIFFQGVFVCAFFLVVASMAENLIAIRRNTTRSN